MSGSLAVTFASIGKVTTVNTHIRNIYSKLGARDRSSAVQRARELRLLSTGRSRTSLK